MDVKRSSWISIAIVCIVVSAVLGFACIFYPKPHRHRTVIANRVDQPEPKPPSLVYHWGYIDPSGIFVIRPSFERAYGMRNGYGEVVGNGTFSDGHTYTEIDRNGCLHLRQLRSSDQPIKAEPDCFKADSRKYRHFSSAGQYGFVDANEHIVIPAKYDFASEFHEKLCAVGL